MHSVSNPRILGSLLVLWVLVAPLAGAQRTSSPAMPTNPAASSSATRVAPVVEPSKAAAPADTSSSHTPANDPDLLIGAGDLLEVTVYGAPDFEKKEARVSSDGDVSLPLIGAVHVANLSIKQAEKLIETKLIEGNYFVRPAVSVFAKEYATQGVSVLGEVQKPGVYPLFGEQHLLNAISMAGGLTAKAGNTVTVAHRAAPGHPVQVMLAGALAESNVPLSPGDTVVVSKAGVVYVVGDVKMPGGFVMENGRLTVLQAIALAQGANSTAALSRAKLIRNAGGLHEETPLDVKKILSAKAPDPSLQAEDIVFVPGSAGKSVTIHGLQAILEAATGAAIYRP